MKDDEQLYSLIKDLDNEVECSVQECNVDIPQKSIPQKKIYDKKTYEKKEGFHWLSKEVKGDIMTSILLFFLIVIFFSITMSNIIAKMNIISLSKNSPFLLLIKSTLVVVLYNVSSSMFVSR